MTPDERRHVALHEAGHAVADIVLGIPVEYASIRPGKTFRGIEVPGHTDFPDGFDPSRLLVQQPAEVRASVERRIVAYFAGDLAALYLSESRPSRPTADDEAIARDALTALGPRLAELVVMREERDQPLEGDEASAWQLANAFGGPELIGLYHELLRRQAMELVIRYRAAILRVADALERHAVLKGEQIAALVHPPKQEKK